MNLRDSARGQECFVRLDCCNGNPETTVLAHFRISACRAFAASDRSHRTNAPRLLARHVTTRLMAGCRVKTERQIKSHSCAAF